jgi:hypothetical protein
MNRTITFLLATVVALAVMTSLAALGTGSERAGQTGKAGKVARMPVENTTLVCPRPTTAELATTDYTAYTPPDEGAYDAGNGGTASLLPAPEYAPDPLDEDTKDRAPKEKSGKDKAPKALLPLEKPGLPVTATVTDADAPALTGTAGKEFAPGWTVQQSTITDSGSGRGLLGTSCQPPDTEFWFAGASTVESRHDYLHLTNSDASATVVDIEIYGAAGRLESESGGEGITVPGGTTVPVAVATLTDEPETNLALRATARTGRIGAQLEVVDEQLGADWLAPVMAPVGAMVLPGIPADAETVRLVAFNPSQRDLTLDVALAGPTGTFTPAGNETLFLQSGTLGAIDLADITQGEPGSLLLTPAEGSDPGAVVAALRVTRGDGDQQELAFIPAPAPIEGRATATGNTAKGTQLSLVEAEKSVEVRVTVSAGSDGGEPISEVYTVDSGTTLALAPETAEDTDGHYALTVERISGGPLHAARTLTRKRDGIPMFTVQTMPDDRSTVAVPEAVQDFSVLMTR